MSKRIARHAVLKTASVGSAGQEMYLGQYCPDTPVRLYARLSKNNNVIFELTVPTNSPSSLYKARMRKQSEPEYISLITDLVSMGM